MSISTTIPVISQPTLRAVERVEDIEAIFLYVIYYSLNLCSSGRRSAVDILLSTAYGFLDLEVQACFTFVSLSLPITYSQMYNRYSVIIIITACLLVLTTNHRPRFVGFRRDRVL